MLLILSNFPVIGLFFIVPFFLYKAWNTIKRRAEDKKKNIEQSFTVENNALTVLEERNAEILRTVKVKEKQDDGMLVLKNADDINGIIVKKNENEKPRVPRPKEYGDIPVHC